jgi:hypothetical protein
MITARDLLILRLALSVVCIAAAADFLCLSALAQNNRGNSDNPVNTTNQCGNVQGAPEANYVDPQTIPYIIMPRWPPAVPTTTVASSFRADGQNRPKRHRRVALLRSGRWSLASATSPSRLTSSTGILASHKTHFASTAMRICAKSVWSRWIAVEAGKKTPHTSSSRCTIRLTRCRCHAPPRRIDHL